MSAKEEPQATSVLATWWRLEAPHDGFHAEIDKIHHYVVRIQPARPLAVGLRVQLLALSRVAYHSPGTVFPRYETYDPHVVGEIRTVVAMGEESESVTFEIWNECRANPVRRIRISIKRLEGQTVTVAEAGAWVNSPPPDIDLSLEHGLEFEVAARAPDARALCAADECALTSNDAITRFEILLFPSGNRRSTSRA